MMAATATHFRLQHCARARSQVCLSLLCHISLHERLSKFIRARLGGGNKRGPTARSSSNILDTIKVLGQEKKIKSILGSSTLDSVREFHNGTLKTIHDSLSLLGNSHSTQVLGFSLSFRRLDLEDFLSLSPLRHSEFETLTGVNLIHGILDPLIRIKIGDQTLKNLISVLRHGLRQSALDRHGKILLCLKHSIKFQIRQFSTENVKHMRGDLTPGISQRIKGFINLLLQYLELNRDNGGKEYVVHGFGFDADIELLDAVGEFSGHFFDAADEESETWIREAFEFSESFDYAYFGG